MLTVTLAGTTAEGASWVPMPPMQQARAGFGMVLAGTHIVAIGGSSEESAHLRTTETLNIADLAGGDAKWVEGPQMAHERRYPGVAVQTFQRCPAMQTPAPEPSYKPQSSWV